MLYDPLLDAQIAQRPALLSTLAPAQSSIGENAGVVPAQIGQTAVLATLRDDVKRRQPLPGLRVGCGEFSPGNTTYYERADNPGLSAHAGASGVMAIEFVTIISAYGAIGAWWVSKWNTSGPVAEFLVAHSSTGVPQVTFGTSGGSTVMTLTYSKALALNRPYHIAIEYDRALPKLSMFVDGVEESTTSASGNTSDTATVLTIGRRMDGTRYFDGRMSHMAIYPRRLGQGVWREHAALAKR